MVLEELNLDNKIKTSKLFRIVNMSSLLKIQINEMIDPSISNWYR